MMYVFVNIKEENMSQLEYAEYVDAKNLVEDELYEPK